MARYRFNRSSWRCRYSPGQRKYRRNIFLKLRALGYTTKDELKPFLPTIRQAVCNRVPFPYPINLRHAHNRAIGEAKAEKRRAEAFEAARKLRQERLSSRTQERAPIRFSWF